jgi:tetratricopeptide (TPR) repeat protein
MKKLIAFLLSIITVTSFAEVIQDNASNVHVKLLELEEKVRELNGKLQYVDYTYKKIMDRLNEISTNLNTRVGALENTSRNKEPVAVVGHGNINQYVQMIEHGQYKDAADGLLGYIKANQDIVDLDEAYYLLGKAYMRLDKYDHSSACFLKSYKNYPTKPRASKSLLRLAESLQKLEKFNRACSILDRLDREYPNRSDDEKKQSVALQRSMKCEGVE